MCESDPNARESKQECSSSVEPRPWDFVWEKELDQIELRRRMTLRREATDRGEPLTESTGEQSSEYNGGNEIRDSGDTTEAVTRRALSMNLVGLAFSGGGIRSATFNLGVLQGLAEQKLLKHVDYLSTVSGGGFIGSWFTALVRRQKDGVRQVENVLQPIRRDQSAFPAERGNSIENRQECEPEPIAHLLAYSNYLAPKLGMLSPDTLSLVAAYVRNLVANLLVLIPALVACIALIRLGHAGFLSTKLTDIRCAPEIAAVLTVALLIAALLLMGTAVGRIRCIRRHQKKEQVPVDQQYHLPTGIYTWTVVLLMLGAISAVWLLSSRDHLTGLWGADLSSLQEQIHTVSLFFAALAVVSYLLQELWQGMDRFRWSSLLARAVGGAAGGFLIHIVVDWGFWRDERMANQSFDFVVGIPLILFSWIVASKIALALGGNGIEEDEREWWGRLAATTARAAMVWLVVTGIAIFGPSLVEQSAYWIRGTVTAAWLASTVGGILAGRSAGSPKDESFIRRCALASVPYIFLVGLICGLALAVSNIVDAPSTAYVSTDFADIWHRVEDYENRLRETPPWSLVLLLVGSGCLSLYASRQVNVNSISLNNLYANRLSRCYLGATRPKERRSDEFGRPVSSESPGRQAHPWTDFDALDDIELCRLVVSEHHDNREKGGYDGPFQLFNTAINLAGSKSLAQQDRKANSFTLTPLYCGNPRLGFRPTGKTEYRSKQGFGGDLTVGRAVAISGAAANPNMGERTSPALAALMTLFNVRLGWWVGNPRDSRRWHRPGPPWALGSLLVEMMSGTDNEHGYVNLSDGGHFENMGVYELVRRRCRYIIAVDCGADPNYEFEDLGNLVRKCRIDLGVEIQINVDSVRRDPETGKAKWHCAVGAIRYDYLDVDAPLGTLIYIKPVMTGDEPPDLANYAEKDPVFPQQSTADQFFSESQFESYRELGRHTVWAVFSESAKRAREVSNPT